MEREYTRSRIFPIFSFPFFPLSLNIHFNNPLLPSPNPTQILYNSKSLIIHSNHQSPVTPNRLKEHVSSRHRTFQLRYPNSYRFLCIVRRSRPLDLSRPEDDIARFQPRNLAPENKVSQSVNASAIGRPEHFPLQKIIHDRGEDRHWGGLWVCRLSWPHVNRKNTLSWPLQLCPPCSPFRDETGYPSMGSTTWRQQYSSVFVSKVSKVYF